MKYSDLAVRDYSVQEYFNKKYSRRLARLKKDIFDDVTSRMPKELRKSWKIGIELRAIQVERRPSRKKRECIV